jgi:TasA anchoring/assembly protein
LRKFGKKNKVLWLTVKFFAAMYLLIGMSAAISGNTNAFLNDSTSASGVFKAGTWETEEAGCSENHGHDDCSKLKIIKEGMEGKLIYAIIENTGADMRKDGTFEVYYIEKGNPENGKIVSNALSYSPIKKGESFKLTFEPKQSGIYKFKSYDVDHPGRGVREIWSGKIEVKKSSKIVEKESNVTEQEPKNEKTDSTQNSEENKEVVEKENLSEDQSASTEKETKDQSASTEKETEEPSVKEEKETEGENSTSEQASESQETKEIEKEKTENEKVTDPAKNNETETK